MIRRPPRSTLDRSSAASDVYKRQPRERTTRRKALALGGRATAELSYVLAADDAKARRHRRKRSRRRDRWTMTAGIIVRCAERSASSRAAEPDIEERGKRCRVVVLRREGAG